MRQCVAMMRMKVLAAAVVFCPVVLAQTSSVEPVVVGKTFLASSTDPRSGSTAWSLTSHGIAEKLFTVNAYGDIVPQVAESVTKVSELVWEVKLKSGYYFSDGSQVTAEHVVAALSELNQENPSAQSSLGAMTLTVAGELEVRIESERATHVMDAVLAEWVFVVYYVNVSGDFVFTGPFEVADFVDGDHIDLVPNSYYPRAEERSALVVEKYADGDALAEALKNQKIDVAFHLPIDTLKSVRNSAASHVKTFEVGYHYMMWHNVRESSALADPKVRQAVDVAIDRNVLACLAGGLGTRSLFPEYTPYFWDETDVGGDVAAAEALLDEAGWILSSEGKRFKEGEELTIKLVAYPHRPGLVIMQPRIEETLTSMGMTVNSVLTGQDWSETQKIIDDADFDLLMWAQNTLPAGDPLWFLSSFFRSDGGNNHAGFSSNLVDALLDALSVAEDHSDRVSATENVHAAIRQEVPVSNLITPFWHVGLSDRMKTYEPWGSDYYVVRADLFLDEAGVLISEQDSKKKSSKDATLFIVLFVVAAVLLCLLGLFVAFVVHRERAGEPVFMPPGLNPLLQADQVELPDAKDVKDT